MATKSPVPKIVLNYIFVASQHFARGCWKASISAVSYGKKWGLKHIFILTLPSLNPISMILMNDELLVEVLFESTLTFQVFIMENNNIKSNAIQQAAWVAWNVDIPTSFLKALRHQKLYRSAVPWLSAN